MSSKEQIIYIEAGDHMITDEAKRHKLALMLVCSFVLMISYYNNTTVGSLFGIIKFKEGSEIGVIELIPFSLAVMMYHGFVYAYHFNEAKKAWTNKIKKEKIKVNILHFNNINTTINKSKRVNIDEIPKNIEFSSCENTVNSRTKTINHLNKFYEISKYESTPQSRRSDIENLKELVYKIYFDINGRQRLPSSTSIDVFKDPVQKLFDKIQELNIKSNNDMVAKDKIIHIEACCDHIDETIKNINKFYIEKYNYFLEENYRRNYEHNIKIKEAITQRTLLINELKKTSFNEKSAMLLYRTIPAIYFSAALISGILTYVENSPVQNQMNQKIVEEQLPAGTPKTNTVL